MLNLENQTVLDHFSDLLAVPSPSGYEQAVAQVVRNKVEAIGYTAEIDPSGNVLVRFAGQDKSQPLTYYASHMDEIGMVVTHIEADGKLAVERSGGLFPFKIGERPVTILGDKQAITGIVSMGSTHSAPGEGSGHSWNSVRINTGLSPLQLKDAGVRVGTSLVPMREGCGPIVFGNPADPLVAAWTFDDKLGCAVLLSLLEHLKSTGKEPLAPTVIAFTVAEEVGGLGAKALCGRERPDIFVAVDGQPITPNSPLTLDGRPATVTKDRLAIYDKELIIDLMAAAERAGTEMQTVVLPSASDASLVYSVGLADRVVCFGQVRENSHGYEVARLNVFGNVLKTLIEFIN
ncbi:MAG: putative aminopeptidase FrvX [Cellvibrionaceae bacterium]|jgi:putative aminopeptidase FrvX